MKRSEIKPISIKDIITDSRIQRPLDPYRIRDLKKEFQLTGVGVICVSAREGGKYAVLDGQHRIAVMRELNLSNPVVAEVWYGLTLKDEAALFIERNNTVKVKYGHKFTARIVKGDPTALAVTKLVNYFGWRVPGQEFLGPEFAAVFTLEKLYLRDEDLSRKTLYVISNSFGIGGADHRIVGGIFNFLKKYEDEVDERRLIFKLQSYSDGPEALIQKAQTLKEMFKGNIRNAIADLIRREYNKNKREGHRLGEDVHGE